MTFKKTLCALAALTTVSIVNAQLRYEPSDLRARQSDGKDYTDLQIRDGRPDAAAVLTLSTSGATVRSRAAISTVFLVPQATVPIFRLDAKGSKDFRFPDKMIPDRGLFVQVISASDGRLDVSNVLRLAPSQSDAKSDARSDAKSDRRSDHGSAQRRAPLADAKADGRSDEKSDQRSDHKSDHGADGGAAEAVLSDYKGDGQTDLTIDGESPGEREAGDMRADKKTDSVRSLEEGA